MAAAVEQGEDAETAAHRDAVFAALEAIADPCSVAFGKPLGLVAMGMVEDLRIEDGRVALVLLPTFPTCMFRGVFEEEIERRLIGLAWCRAVSVTFAPADRTWDESRLSIEARAVLGRRSAHKNNRSAPVEVA